MADPTAADPSRRPQPLPPVSFPDRDRLGPSLPAPLSEFLGRERDVAHLVALLLRPGVRLVTLTGPGGVGKTRLALHVGWELEGEFPDGVAFVTLAPIVAPKLVGSTVAAALGVREARGVPLTERLASALRDRRQLLVLDNFEHVLTAAPLVANLLAACPRLTVLATSREVLSLSGEHAVAVRPLALPDAGSPPSAAAITEIDAVRLFVARAVAARSDFALTDENAADVAEICRRLDGLPLAIELAAARVAHLPPAALLRRLGHRLPLLTGGARDLPARQQAMSATIAWSYDLLTAEEQVLIRRLAVFVGGFTLEAAEAVASTGTLGAAVFAGIPSLVAKSLLWQDEGPDGELRYAMLETVREYASERLATSGDGEAVRRRHAEWFLARAEAMDSGLWGPAHLRWLDAFEADRDNLRAALAWAAERDEPETGLRLARALTWFWKMRGPVSEGDAWFARFLGHLGAVPPVLQAQALTEAGDLARTLGDVERAIVFLEAAQVRWQAAGDPPGTGGWGWGGGDRHPRGHALGSRR